MAHGKPLTVDDLRPEQQHLLAVVLREVIRSAKRLKICLDVFLILGTDDSHEELRAAVNKYVARVDTEIAAEKDTR